MMQALRSLDVDETVVRAVAVDSPNTLVREDAFVIHKSECGWRVKVCVSDMAELVGADLERWNERYLRRARASFVTDCPREGLLVTMSVSRIGRVCITQVCKGEVVLEAVYDEISAAAALEDGSAPQSLKELSPLALALTGGTAKTAPGSSLSTLYLHEMGRRMVLSPNGPGEGVVQDVAGYARFTSPLRRIADMANVECLLAAASGAPEPFTQAELLAFASVDDTHGRFTRHQRLASAWKARCLADQDEHTTEWREETPPADMPPDPASHAKAISAVDDEELLRLSASQFRTLLRQRDEDVSHLDLEGEFMRRLGDGRLDAVVLADGLLHPRRFASASTTASALAVVRGYLYGARLPEFVARSVQLACLPQPSVWKGTQSEVEWEVRISIGAIHHQRGHGDTQEEAELDALGRLACSIYRTDPRSTPDFDGLLAEPALVRLTAACMQQGIVLHGPEVQPGYGSRFHQATVMLEGAPHPFIGQASAIRETEEQAVERACEKVEGWLRSLAETAQCTPSPVPDVAERETAS
jgi:hypothetical protein